MLWDPSTRRFVERHLYKVASGPPVVGFVLGVLYGVTHIDPTVPGNPVIGCILIGLFGAVFIGFMGIDLMLTWLRVSRELEKA